MKLNDNVFKEGSVPVAVVARVYGKDASWVRAGIISGWLPIGKATRNGNRSLNLDSYLFVFTRNKHFIL